VGRQNYETDDDSGWQVFEPFLGDLVRERGFQIVRRWKVPTDRPTATPCDGVDLANNDLILYLSRQWGQPEIVIRTPDSPDGITLENLLDEIDGCETSDTPRALPTLARRLTSDYDTVLELMRASNRGLTTRSVRARLQRHVTRRVAEVSEEEDRKNSSLWRRLGRLFGMVRH
jgi:hypothetical protein